MTTIRRVDPRDVRPLITALDDYLNSLYPPESNHLASEADLRRANVRMFGLFAGERPVAMGAVKLLAGYGELKRVFVDPDCRGQGFAKRILLALEQESSTAGVEIVRLEAGIYQPEAIALYARCGYVRRGPFGPYGDDPYSVFMEKRLAVAQAAR